MLNFLGKCTFVRQRQNRVFCNISYALLDKDRSKMASHISSLVYFLTFFIGTVSFLIKFSLQPLSFKNFDTTSFVLSSMHLFRFRETNGPSSEKK